MSVTSPVKQELIAEAEYDLYRAGLTWTTGNGGVHLRVLGAGGRVVAHLWPSAGHWRLATATGGIGTNRQSKSGYGTESLVDLIRERKYDVPPIRDRDIHSNRDSVPVRGVPHTRRQNYPELHTGGESEDRIW